MKFLPIFLDLRAAPVALIGDDAAAQAKLRLLRAAGARVVWFRPGWSARPSDGVGSGGALSASDQAQRNDPPDHDPLGMVVVAGDPLDQVPPWNFAAVIAALPSPQAERIAARAKADRIPVNIVDRPELSTFILPAIVDRGDVVIAISTGGAAPVLARRLREKIEALLPVRIGAFATWLGAQRARVAACRPASPRAFWEKIVDGRVASDFLAGDLARAEMEFARTLAGETAKPRAGSVALVGAGPGDADLLTLRALHALQEADIVFYDDLIGPDILNRARRDADLVFVGKRRGAPGIGQEAINRHLIVAAQAGKRVVRLKGGDPFVFGRGGEEVAALRAAGIEVTIVPGITAVLGGAAEAGLPLTLRQDASRLCLITAQHAEAAAATNWDGLGAADTTVIVYMGLAAAARVRDGLIEAGRDPRTPAAVLSRVTHADSRRVYGQLADLPALAARAGNGPALLIIGAAVAQAAGWPDHLLSQFESAA